MMMRRSGLAIDSRSNCAPIGGQIRRPGGDVQYTARRNFQLLRIKTVGRDQYR